MASVEQSIKKNNDENKIFPQNEIKRILAVSLITFAIRELINEIFGRR